MVSIPVTSSHKDKVARLLHHENDVTVNNNDTSKQNKMMYIMQLVLDQVSCNRMRI